MGCTRLVSLLAIIWSLPLLSASASAWSNGGYSADQANPDEGTHDWIAEAAAAMQTRDVSFLTATFHSRFLLGTEAPDNPDFIGDTIEHHVYFTSDRQVQDDSSAARARTIYQLALGYLKGGDFEGAAYDIGVMTHYIADPGVFGHTMGSSTDWGTEVHHSDYENHFETIVESFSYPSGLVLGDSDAYNATLDLSEDITFGDGAIQPNVWMDTHYDWSDRQFVSSARASLNRSVAAVAAVLNHLMIEIQSDSLPQQIPQIPVSVAAVLQGSSVVLTWSPPGSDGGAGITGYRIYRATNPASPELVSTVPGSVHSWTDSSVKKGATYYYWVTAENSVGSSGMSQMTSATIPRSSPSLVMPVTISAIFAALASGGVLLWRRKNRAR